jgi:hypothetical protein
LLFRKVRSGGSALRHKELMMNRTKSKALLLSLALSGLSWTSISGQGLIRVNDRGLVESYERGSFGGSVILAQPVGEFDQFVGLGGGLNLFGVVGLAPKAGLGLRIDGTFLVYGNESQPVPFAGSPRIELEMTTTNSIATFGIGPQLTVGRGVLSAYGYGLAGFSYFSTFSNLNDLDYGESIATTTNFDDTTWSFSGGGGIRVRLGNGAKPVALDFGVVALQNGRAEYLRRGSIREAADGSVFYTPIRSEANLVNFKLGITAVVF